jgi:hypothetical protein
MSTAPVLNRQIYCGGTIRHIDKTPASGIIPRNAEQPFALDALAINLL